MITMNVFRRAARPAPADASPFAKLFADRRLAPVWLVVRVYLAYQWITAGLHKLGDPGWTATGASLQKFWSGAAAIPAAPAKPAITYDFYRGFLQFLLDTHSYTWFAKLVVFGELAVGVALLVGAFVGVAAFFGALMNWNFMMAGTASTNPLMFTLAIVLVLAWKTAGYLGADLKLLPLVGTPWKPGEAFPRAAAVTFTRVG